jgi:hypothetical protein
MIRITTQKKQGYAVVTIDGQATAEDTTEIRQTRSSLTDKVVLNLAGLSSCSDEGIEILRDWLDKGARLQDANLYIRMILKDPPSLNKRGKTQKPLSIKKQKEETKNEATQAVHALRSPGCDDRDNSCHK